MSAKQIDAELRRQLAAASPGRPVSASLILQTDPASLPEPNEVEAQVARLLERVGEQTGQQATDVHVLGNIGSFIVQGPAEFVARLAQQPEVASAMASQPAEDVLIRPVKRRAVPGPRKGDRKKPSRGGEDGT